MTGATNPTIIVEKKESAAMVRRLGLSQLIDLILVWALSCLFAYHPTTGFAPRVQFSYGLQSPYCGFHARNQYRLERKCKHRRANLKWNMERDSIANGRVINGSVDDVPFSTNNPFRFRSALHDLSVAALVGIVTGLLVAFFKISINAVRHVSYTWYNAQRLLLSSPSTPTRTIWMILGALIPAIGGLTVGLLRLLGPFAPGLRGTVDQVDEESIRRSMIQSPRKRQRAAARGRVGTDSLRKSAAAVLTLGTGCSLGPEGPCVELGMNVARTCGMDWLAKADVRGVQQSTTTTTRSSGSGRMVSSSSTNATLLVSMRQRRVDWNRVLLSCGAAAGVAAGFDAPLAGVFFALEVMQPIFAELDDDRDTNSRTDGAFPQLTAKKGRNLFSSTFTIAPVLIASVLSALSARSLLDQHLMFQVGNYRLPNPLLELPCYLLLGVVSGCVAFTFSRAAKTSQSVFDGNSGSRKLQCLMRAIPPSTKPVLGGLFCGLTALAFPQILFFGYETLNTILANSRLPTSLLLSLLFAKGIATAVAAGSGLVGGTFAPCLFLGAMTGASFHNVLTKLCSVVGALWLHLGWTTNAVAATMTLADLPAYAMVGSASVLASLFRAPLTASLLLFELSRDYDVILPLLASAGVGSFVADILDSKFERAKEMRRDRDATSWGDLSDI